MQRAGTVKMLQRGAASAMGVVLLTFLTAASEKSSDPKSEPANEAAANPPANEAPSLEEELKSFEEQLVAPSSAESLFANGRAPDLVVVSSTDVHGEIEPCG